MKYFLIAGEASGDLHGSNLMKAIKEEDPNADFQFLGGDLMQAVGGKLIKHYKDMSFMGFIEVIANLPAILNNLKLTKKSIHSYWPDVVIFIDFPGFNLRLAKYVKSLKIKTVYYISPQLWAWKEGRIKTIKQYIDKLLVILPFEHKWYKERGVEAIFVGHPLLDALSHYKFETRTVFIDKNNLEEKPIIALLPGSRKQEIEKKLPLMLKVKEHFPKYQFVIGGSPAQNEKYYDNFTNKETPVVFGQTYDLLNLSESALVTSGTATLETALINTPEVVCYKGSWVSYQIGKRLVKGIKYISLVNLIMDKELVSELIQDKLTAFNIQQELNKSLQSPKHEEILEGYIELRQKLGGPGASQRAASEVISLLKS